MRDFRRFAGVALVATAIALIHALGTGARGQETSIAPPEALHEHTPAVHALVGAKLVLSPGRVIERGSVIIRDGRIVAIGASDDVSPPADARVWDVSGKTIYPGLIDAYGEVGEAPAGRGPGASGAGPAQQGSAEGVRPAGGATHWNSRVTPQLRMDQHYRGDAENNSKLRSQGVVARLIAPSRPIIKGISVAVSTSDAGGSRSILKPTVAMHLQLTPGGGFGAERSYPVSPMGAVALVRQTMLDAQWYARAWSAWEAETTLPRPEKNDALEALQPVIAGAMPVMIDAGDEQYALRADRVAREFKLHLVIRGSGQEYRRLDEISAAGRTIVVPVNFSRPPNVASPEAAMEYSLEDLMDWDLQPENPARLERAGVRIALTSHGLRDKATFLSQVRKAVARGLPREAALRALTTAPAELLGISESHGTLEVGKSASLVITDGELFDSKTHVLETWVEGQRHEITPQPKADARGTWALSFEGGKSLRIELSGEPNRPRGRIVNGRTATRPATRPASQAANASRGERGSAELSNVAVGSGLVSFTLKGEPLGLDGIVQISAAITGDTWMGSAVRPDGTTFEFTGRRVAPGARAAGRDSAGSDDAPGRPTTRPAEAVAAAPEQRQPPPGERVRPTTSVSIPPDGTPATQPTSPALARQAERASTQPALFDVNYPLGAHGRPHLPEQPAAVLFKNATVWTCGPRGKLAEASVLLEHGKVAAVFAKGESLERVPADAKVIDCAGQHLSPGIIDCHSHIATDGGINEGSQSVTCEVRIGDFIDPTDINIYRQLGGGVTTAHILHGSANTIGGQSQVIKLRWGASDEEMKFREAPPTVKFALGENVKRSSSETSTRYPRTRMGVEQVLRDSFSAARDYREAWNRYRANPRGVPPRVDLELEALCEILDGRRLIHCHSYRQDEVLALLRTCESFGVRVAVLQHILEGYKLADVMAKHGAAGSTFSDWWAYKFEVFDAIPYNGAIMHDAGVVVSFNSDDAELARRLNLEAAKAVKYGGVPEEEALKFVTLNPARQLRVDSLVGSIEPGKQADLVVWSGSPLSTVSRCEQTWIDGRRYFDREEDQQMRTHSRAMRAALVQKILGSGDAPAEAGENPPRPRELWRQDEHSSAGDCGMHSER